MTREPKAETARTIDQSQAIAISAENLTALQGLASCGLVWAVPGAVHGAIMEALVLYLAVVAIFVDICM